jgi:uncharacterized membrane-anchored protein YhcB (DUF1043 family)
MRGHLVGSDLFARAPRASALESEEETLRTHLGTTARRRALVALGGLALAALAACKTSGVERSQATQSTIADFKTELQNYGKHLDATFASLDELVKNAKVDPKGEFAKFSANLDLLVKSAENAKSNSEQMKSLGDAYFAEWEKSAATITNEDIRKISDQRRAELQKSYKDLQTAMTTVAADAKPLREQLISLREYYLQDLTEKGIEATKTPISNAKSASTKVTKGIKTVLDEVDKVATQLKVAAPPPPPADGKPPEKK